MSIALLQLLLAACAAIPAQRSAVDQVVVQGTEELDDDEIKERIATAPSPKFLGLFRGLVYDYELLDRLTLQRDLARVERYCRARGYYDCRVRAGRILQLSSNHVRVEIEVEEGLPSKIASLGLHGMAELPAEVQAELSDETRQLLPVGSVFDEDEFTSGEAKLKERLANLGYARATVKRDAAVDVVRRAVDVVFRISAGEKAVFGTVRIEGLAGLPRGPVLRAIDIYAGDPYAKSALDSARQALLDLGVFSSVELIPELSESPGRVPEIVPVLVKVEPTKLRTIRLGGGVEFDTIKTDVHGLIGWEDRNFLGDLRFYSITLKPGVVLYPLRVDSWEMPNRLLPELKVVNQLRRSGFIEARTTGFVRPEVGVFPVLLKTNPRPSDPIPGYVEFKLVAGVERTIKRLFGWLSYTLQLEAPFAYKGEIDGALRPLVISYPELVTNLSLTDDRLQPGRGVFLGNIFQAAGGPFGGHADDINLQPDARAYIPITRGITFAARVAVGLLFPRNYGFSASEEDVDLTTNQRSRARDQQLLFFRGFFAGGPNSNRGYPLRGIGPRGFVSSYNAGGVSNLAACESISATGIADACKVPIGGLTRWESSAEVRFSVTGPFSIATFCDAADVAPEVAEFRLSHLHLSCGVGGRYDTPVGPVRLDIGYRIPGLQVLESDASEAQELKPLFGVFPVAVAIGLGEAF